MFAIGHFALGYLTGKGSSKLLNTNLNLPLLLVASVLPDVDLILQGFDQTLFMHRGPAHSIITFTVFMIPLFVIYRKQAIPYYVALLSHSLIGDVPTGGVEMLWPISQSWFGSDVIPMAGVTDVIAEMLLFAVATAIMFKIGDLKKLLQPKTRNWVLIIAFGAVLGPMFAMRYSSAGLPLLLVPASVFWLIVFAYSILKDLRSRDENKKVMSLPKTQTVNSPNAEMETAMPHGQIRISDLPRRIPRNSSSIQQPNCHNS